MVSFLFGYYMGKTSNKITPDAEAANLDMVTCPARCGYIVNASMRLWPSLETAFKLLRIIPNTPLACERICIAKGIKNL